MLLPTLRCALCALQLVVLRDLALPTPQQQLARQADWPDLGAEHHLFFEPFEQLMAGEEAAGEEEPGYEEGTGYEEHGMDASGVAWPGYGLSMSEVSFAWLLPHGFCMPHGCCMHGCCVNG